MNVSQLEPNIFFNTSLDTFQAKPSTSQTKLIDFQANSVFFQSEVDDFQAMSNTTKFAGRPQTI